MDAWLRASRMHGPWAPISADRHADPRHAQRPHPPASGLCRPGRGHHHARDRRSRPDRGRRAQGRVIHATGVAGLRRADRQPHPQAGRQWRQRSGARYCISTPATLPQIYSPIRPAYRPPYRRHHRPSDRPVNATMTTRTQHRCATGRGDHSVRCRRCRSCTAPEVVERWAGAAATQQESRAPMLGEHPLHENQFIANGGFKIGFGMAPKVAAGHGRSGAGRHAIQYPCDFRARGIFLIYSSHAPTTRISSTWPCSSPLLRSAPQPRRPPIRRRPAQRQYPSQSGVALVR